MANVEESVYNDPNFAVICSFLERFGDLCGISNFTTVHLQEMLEDTRTVHQDLIDLHVKLLRRSGQKSVPIDKWERVVIKFCHSYSKVDAWEIERFGYKKARLAVKIGLMKRLLECQFDSNPKFKNEINKLPAEELRLLPIGKDLKGHLYWLHLDKDLNLRIYCEDQDEETWELIVKERGELVTLIENLESSGDAGLKKEDDSTTPSDTGESKDGEASLGNQCLQEERESVPAEKFEFHVPKLNLRDDVKPVIKVEPLSTPVEENISKKEIVNPKFERNDDCIKESQSKIESQSVIESQIKIKEEPGIKKELEVVEKVNGEKDNNFSSSSETDKDRKQEFCSSNASSLGHGNEAEKMQIDDNSSANINPVIRESVIRLAEKPVVSKDDHPKCQTNDEPLNEASNGFGRPKNQSVLSVPDLPQELTKDEKLSEPKVEIVKETEKQPIKDIVTEKPLADIGKTLNKETLENPEIAVATKVVASPLKVDHVESKEKGRSERMIMPLKKRELPKDLSTGDMNSATGDDVTLPKTMESVAKCCVYQTPVIESVSHTLNSDSIATEVCDGKQERHLEGNTSENVEPNSGTPSAGLANSNLCSSKKSEDLPVFVKVSDQNECKQLECQKVTNDKSEKTETIVNVDFIDTGQKCLERKGTTNKLKGVTISTTFHTEMRAKDVIEVNEMHSDQHSPGTVDSKEKERTDSDSLVSKRDSKSLVNLDGSKSKHESSENKCADVCLKDNLGSVESKSLDTTTSPEQRLVPDNEKSNKCQEESCEAQNYHCDSVSAKDNSNCAKVIRSMSSPSIEKDVESVNKSEQFENSEPIEEIGSASVGEPSKVEPMLTNEKREENEPQRSEEDRENKIGSCSDNCDSKRKVGDDASSSLELPEKVLDMEVERDADKVSESRHIDSSPAVKEIKNDQEVKRTENEESEGTISKAQNVEATVTSMDNDSTPSPPPERRMTRSFRARQNNAIAAVTNVEKEKEVLISKDLEVSVNVAKDDKVTRSALSKGGAHSPKPAVAPGTKSANKSTDHTQAKESESQELKKRKWASTSEGSEEVEGNVPIKRSSRIRAQRQKFEEEQRRVEENLQREAFRAQELLHEERKKKQNAAAKQNGEVERGKKRTKESKGKKKHESTNKKGSKSSKKKDKKKKKKKKPTVAKKKKNKKGYNPWDFSSGSTTPASSEQEEDNYDDIDDDDDDEELVFNVTSDHEFSPESETEDFSASATQIKRARTVKKAKSGSDDDSSEGDDKPCSKCGKYDHPEWILLCDKCDSGYHTSCLRPPLMVIPDGDWYCPQCSHRLLVEKLHEQLKNLDQLLKKKDREEMRRKRLAFVGISLDNVLKPEKNKKESIGDEEESNDNECEGDEGDDDEDYVLSRKRSRRPRKEVSYQFKEFDELINSAIQDEVIPDIGGLALSDWSQRLTQQWDRVQEELGFRFGEDGVLEEAPQGYGKGKDMSNITDAMVAAEDDDFPSLRKRRHRRLNDLDTSTEEDDDKDEDFKGSSSNSELVSEEESGVAEEESDESWRESRRSRARRRREDADFINDESEDSEDNRRVVRRAAAKSVNYKEESDSDDHTRSKSGKSRLDFFSKSKSFLQKSSRTVSDDDSEEESDDSDWKKPKKRMKHSTTPTSSKKSGRKSWRFESADEDKEDEEEDEEESEESDEKFATHRTRGKKINYKEVMGSGSSEEDLKLKKKSRFNMKDFEKDDNEESSEEEDDDNEEEEEGGDGEDEEEEDDEEDEEDDTSSEPTVRNKTDVVTTAKDGDKPKVDVVTETGTQQGMTATDKPSDSQDTSSLKTVPNKGESESESVGEEEDDCDLSSYPSLKADGPKASTNKIPPDEDSKMTKSEDDQERTKESGTDGSSAAVDTDGNKVNKQSVIRSVESVKKEILENSKSGNSSSCQSPASDVKPDTATTDVKPESATPAKGDASPAKSHGGEEIPFSDRLRPIDYQDRPSPLKPSAVEPYPVGSSPSKLTLLDTFPSRSSPQSKLTLLDPYSTSLSSPSPGLQSYDRTRPPGPVYHGDYGGYPGQYYPPNYPPGSSQYSPSPPLSGYQSSPNPYPPYQQHSPNYNYMPQGYNEQGPYHGPPPPQYGPVPYGNYSPPPHPTPPTSQPAAAHPPQGQPNGRFSIDSLLQRRMEGATEEDDFSSVNDLVSYITGSHENPI